MNEEESDTTLRDLAKGWDTPKVSSSETPEMQAQEEPKGTWVWIPENSASWLETMVSKLVESKLEETKGDEDDMEQIATNAIENYDFSSLLDQALQEHDFSDALENDLQQVKDDIRSEFADQIREEVEECLRNATISI